MTIFPTFWKWFNLRNGRYCVFYLGRFGYVTMFAVVNDFGDLVRVN